MDGQLTTISQISKSYGVSTRMLRYYEKAGLLQSRRMEGYAYRVYDAEAIARLKQILLLRKLRIPVKEIKEIFQNPEAVTAINVFERNIAELTDEIQALNTVRGILRLFLTKLYQATDILLQLLLTSDDIVLSALDSLNIVSINFKEDRTLEQLNKADKKLSRLKDVRIITLPPATVAAAHYIGDDPEQNAGKMMDVFVKKHRLWQLKPDVRSYGFNHPNPSDETGNHGYELWVTIPDDMEVPAPLEKKRFAGGLYAAHMVQLGNFSEWEDLIEWIAHSDKYEFAGDFADQQHMCGLLDEHLNYVADIQRELTETEDTQFDLLAPVRLKTI